MLRACARRRIPFRWGRSRGLTSASTVLPTTAVEKIIIDGIKATGPISFSTYMQMCLSHLTEGYYMNPKNPIFGSTGDFVTSPEISSLFGELLGVWLMSQWMQTTSKLPIRIVELGPGRGTLMHDILRVASQFGKSQLKGVHLVETSPTLRALQDARLSPAARKYGCALEWYDSVDQIRPTEDMYTMVVAHEFFDSLPFHTIEKTENGWQEMLIALAADAESDAGQEPPATGARFRYVLAPQPTAASTLLAMSSPRFRDAQVGTRLEVSPLSFKTMRAIGDLVCGVKQDPAAEGFPPSRGCGLIVDYGASHAFSQSFRAFKNHEIVDVFHTPGECDLTANVDFAYLVESVKDLVPTHGPIVQSAFLEGMGLQLRIESLIAGIQSDSAKAALREAGRRLVDPAGMGNEYMVLGIGGQPDNGVVWPFVESPAA